MRVNLQRHVGSIAMAGALACEDPYPGPDDRLEQATFVVAKVADPDADPDSSNLGTQVTVQSAFADEPGFLMIRTELGEHSLVGSSAPRARLTCIEQRTQAAITEWVVYPDQSEARIEAALFADACPPTGGEAPLAVTSASVVITANRQDEAGSTGGSTGGAP